MKTATRLAAIVTLFLATSVSAWAGRCDLDVQPAATLLVPYFDLDLENPWGRTTLFSVANTEAASVLAKVTLWTDWAVPSVSFEVYLTGFDVQTFNVRDVLFLGRVPATGSAVSPQGNLSDQNSEFPGCNAGAEPGDPPVYPDPYLTGALLAEVQALHTGEQGPLSGECGGYPYGDGIARGYITIDTVNNCSDLTPADPGYFAPGGTGVASDRNALFGDYFFVTQDEASAKSDMAVHIEAFPGEFPPGDNTFYGRYLDSSGADDREPLATVFASRHAVGGPFSGGTTLIVWRDTGTADAGTVSCPVTFDWELVYPAPSWWPLGANLTFFSEEEDAAFGGTEGCTDLPDSCDFNFPSATQAFSLEVDSPAKFDIALYPGFEFGMTWLELIESGWFSGSPPIQGWFTTLYSATDLYSMGQRAVRLDSACNE